MRTLITNIKTLVQVDNGERRMICGKDMANLPCINNAWLCIDGETIMDFGSMDTLNIEALQAGCDAMQEFDATGRVVMPTFCDSHSHIVYAGSREIEYIDKIKGLTYEEIAQRGGGILNSAKRIAQATEEELFESAYGRIQEVASYGTGAIEIKSGYGLDTENELKMLRVIKRLQAETPLLIKSTLLAAHAIPMEYRADQTQYVDYIINEMIPAVANEDLADYIDVFCDKGFFTVEDTDRILNAGMKYGLRAKMHANELDYSGGVQVGVKYNALSVDHLEYIGEEEIKALLGSETMPTVLPGAAFFLNMPYSPVRTMIDAGLPIALASDYNPGSSPQGNMKFICSLGCINYKMLPEEVINATTLNSAYAMGVEEQVGSIARGKLANLILTTPISGIEYIPYAYGSDIVEHVFIKGDCY
ncbi:MAG: imidazolonepropionase [Marinifilaceae bacterium]